jgi:hypothetical protein
MKERSKQKQKQKGIGIYPQKSTFYILLAPLHGLFSPITDHQKYHPVRIHRIPRTNPYDQQKAWLAAITN